MSVLGTNVCTRRGFESHRVTAYTMSGAIAFDHEGMLTIAIDIKSADVIMHVKGTCFLKAHTLGLSSSLCCPSLKTHILCLRKL